MRKSVLSAGENKHIKVKQWKHVGQTKINWVKKNWITKFLSKGKFLVYYDTLTKVTAFFLHVEKDKSKNFLWQLTLVKFCTEINAYENVKILLNEWKQINEIMVAG